MEPSLQELEAKFASDSEEEELAVLPAKAAAAAAEPSGAPAASAAAAAPGADAAAATPAPDGSGESESDAFDEEEYWDSEDEEEGGLATALDWADMSEGERAFCRWLGQGGGRPLAAWAPRRSWAGPGRRTLKSSPACWWKHGSRAAPS